MLKEEPMQTQKVDVVVYMESQVLQGYVSIPDNIRLSDFLNSSLANNPDASERFLEMTDVTISYADGKQEQAETIFVNLEAIQMMKTIEKDVARGVGAGDVKSYPFIDKLPVTAKMRIPSYELNGCLHCISGQCLALLLTQKGTFLPCTDVRIHNIHEDTWSDAAFVAINKRRVNSIAMAN
jgi:hypothetical protein